MRMFLTRKEGSMLTRQVKNVIVQANKQKDIIGLFGIKLRSKNILYVSPKEDTLDKRHKWKISNDCIKAFAFKKELEKHVPQRKKKKFVSQRKNVLENIMMKLQRKNVLENILQLDKDDVTPSQPNYN